MKNSRNFVLSALFSLGSMFALTACIDPVVIGGNGGGGSGGNPTTPCMTDAQCPAGQACVNGVCDGGPLMTCNGMPSPLSCTQTGCASGQICVPDPDPMHCYPSNCGCDASTGSWVCTADCGQGSHCVSSVPCGANGACPPNSMCDAAGNCVPVCVPAPETCNGVDDDCDGQVDEQDDPAAPLCSNGAACVMGQCGGPGLPCASDADCPPNELCLNGVCSGGTCSTTEICNGIDDDCNGVVDDGAGAVCADGSLCINGQCGGTTMLCMTDADCPANEQCLNGVCSGGTTTQCGPNTPPCPAGQVCNSMGVCVPSACQPKPEVCNGLDDDCDGVIDNAVPGTTLCTNGAMCVNGSCGGTPVQCGPNTTCPAGQVCTATGICKLACTSNMNCPSGSACVNGVCN